MEPHGFRHFRAEPGFQPDLAQFFMLIIHAMLGGVITQIMHQMADIIQQCRSDQCAEWRQLPGPGDGAPWWIRTTDPQLRRLLLYPTELRAP